ncbi:TPA: hypothetical protein NJ079_005166 [Vibrio parahaemolyticus]|nr:hypothetical protein [Vibrio parahaemolyticus]HCG5935712.1 hypothetical protein [Vibrio parahaemolyticus]
MDELTENKSIAIEETSDNKSLANALYLDGVYVVEEVIRIVIKNAKLSGLLHKNSNDDNKDYQWVIKMVEHQLLILRLQECSKERPYAPSSIKCLNKYIDDLARKISKMLAGILTNYYPLKP